MAKTIGRHHPASSPRGETVAVCAYCGVHWHRSKLKVDEAGNLYCPDEGQGRDVVALSRENQERARKRNRLPQNKRQGGYEKPTFTVTETLTQWLATKDPRVRPQ